MTDRTVDVPGTIDAVLRAAARRSLFGVDNINLNENFNIQLRREWTDPLENITGKFTVVLHCRSAYKGDRDVITMKTETMLELMSVVSKLIEDAKRAVFDDEQFRWIF